DALEQHRVVLMGSEHTGKNYGNDKDSGTDATLAALDEMKKQNTTLGVEASKEDLEHFTKGWPDHKDPQTGKPDPLKPFDPKSLPDFMRHQADLIKKAMEKGIEVKGMDNVGTKTNPDGSTDYNIQGRHDGMKKELDKFLSDPQNKDKKMVFLVGTMHVEQ